MSTLNLNTFKPGAIKLTRNEILEMIAEKLNSDNHKKGERKAQLTRELEQLVNESLKTDKRVNKIAKLAEQLGGRSSIFTEGSNVLGIRIRFDAAPPAKVAAKIEELKKECDEISYSYRHWHKDDVLNTLIHSNAEVQKTVAEMADTVTAAVNSQIPKLMNNEAS